jgi:hypothetical protein
MITLDDIQRWAAGIAASQGTATPEEEELASRIRRPLLVPLDEWACFREHVAKHGPHPWNGVIQGPDWSCHVAARTELELGDRLRDAAYDHVAREIEARALEAELIGKGGA